MENNANIAELTKLSSVTLERITYTSIKSNRDFDALTITDEDVAADWRLGLTRTLALIIAASGKPVTGADGYGLPVPGGNLEHVRGNYRIGSETCELVSVRNIVEEAGERWERGYDESVCYPFTELRAEATCACGRFSGRVTAEISPGDFIMEVARDI